MFSQSPAGQKPNPFAKSTSPTAAPSNNPFAIPGSSTTAQSANVFAPSGSSTTTTTSSNLFGPPKGGAPPTTSSSLFGAPKEGSSTTTSGLFGAPAGGGPPSTTSSLFGAPSGAPSTTSGLFGTSAGSSSSSTTSPSLFGSSAGAPAPVTTSFTAPPPSSAQTKEGSSGIFSSSLTASSTVSFGGLHNKEPKLFGVKDGASKENENLFAPQSTASFAKPELKLNTGSDKKTAPIFGKLPTEADTFGRNRTVAESGGQTPTLFKTSSVSSGGGIFGAKSGTTAGAAAAGETIFGAKSEDSGSKLFSSKSATSGDKLFGSSGSASLFGKSSGPSSGSSSGTLFGKVTEKTSGQFGDQPDIVKPTLSSRLGPPVQQHEAEEGECEDDDEGEGEEEYQEEGEEDYGEEGEEEGEDDGGEGNEEPEGEEVEGGDEVEAHKQQIHDQQPPQARRKLMRNFSKEELQAVTSIVCEQVPNILNNPITLSKHFSRFGTVTKVTPILKSKSAHIHFTDHKGAKLAKARGKLVHPDIEPIGEIYYISISPSGKKRVRRSTDDSAVSVESAGKLAPKPAVTTAAAVDFGAKLKVARKPFSISTALKPQVKSSEEVTGKIDSGLVRKTESQAQLLAIMKTQALNDADRLAVLEARDKYIRLRNPESVTRSGLNIDHGKLKGTCPDMCSERERYSRSAKNQLRWFEKEAGELNHLAAIKEHSRSAADQEFPLSHELRPPNVLNRTLTYLMCNIVDKIDYMGGSMTDWFNFVEACHENGQQFREPMANFPQGTSGQVQFTVGDWFEFVWSMIRAVSKDITQQNLSDIVSVGLVEKSARFYIICAERLIEEDAHDFDPKLNNENLTKCLQTLKHMYYDLRLVGVRCENEAEFQAYDILLNINQGGTLRKVQEFDSYIRNHPSVVHALKIYSAVDGNNYVRFFRLARKSSFLELCILKRYFYQVRRRALEIMVRAFVAPRQVVQLSMDKIFDLLAFESHQECAAFLRQHGIESEEDTVFLERSGFRMPESAPKPRRSYNLIDSKKTVSYGEVMNGGPLPVNPYLTYQPHNSFDANGYLKPESYEAKDQMGGQSPEELRQEQEEEARRSRLLELARQMTDSTITEVIKTEAAAVAVEAVKEVNQAIHIKQIYKSLEEDVVAAELKAIAASAIKDARNAILMQRLAEEQEAEAEEEAAGEVIEDMVQDNIHSVAEEAYADARKEKNSESRLAATRQVVDDLADEVADDLTAQLAGEVMEDMTQELEINVVGLQEARDRRTLSKCFKMWRLLTTKQKKRNQVMDDFPVGAAPLSPRQQNERLSSSSLRPGTLQSPFSSCHKKLSQLQAEREQLDSMLELAVVNKRIQESAVLMPFDILGKLEDSTGSLPVYKLLISSEGLPESHSFYPFQQMVLSKFRKMFPNSGTDSEFIVCRTLPLRSNSTLSLCIRNVTQENLDAALFSERERRRIFSAASGLLFLHLDPQVDPSDRLKALLVNRPSKPAVPLQVLTCWTKQDFLDKTDINQYLDNKLISEYSVEEINEEVFNIENSVTLSRAINQLVHNRPRADPTQGIKKKSLTDYLDGFLTGQIFSEMLRNRLQRSRKGLTDRPLTDLVDLYNAGLDHLVNTLQDAELSEVSWPAQEFCNTDSDLPVNWNDTLYVDETVKIIKSLRMEDFNMLDAATWRDTCDQVWTYVRSCLQVDSGHDCSAVISNITRALDRTFRKFASESSLLGGDTRPDPPLEMLPWTDILITCAQHRLHDLPESERRVGYRESFLHSFIIPQHWTSGLSWVREHEETKVHEHVNSSVCKFRESFCSEDSYLNPELHNILNEEQKESLRYEKKLEAALRDDYVPDSKTLLLDISKLEEEENLLRKEDESNEQYDDIYQKSGCDDSMDEVMSTSVISQISPRLGVLLDTSISPSRSKGHRRSLVDRSNLLPGWQDDSRPSGTPTWGSGRKRKSEAGLAADKRTRKSFQYNDEMSPRLKLEVSGRLDTLKHTINHEMDQSLRLEAKLREALNK